MVVTEQQIEPAEPRVAPEAPPAAIVVHCVLREGLAAVFQAQVLTPIRGYVGQGWDVRLVVFAPLGEFLRREPRARWAKQMAAIRQVVGPRVWRLPSPPSRLRRAWTEHGLLLRRLRAFAGEGQPLIVQCRNAHMTCMALDVRSRVPGNRVIFDCRGIDDVEYRMSLGYADDAVMPPAEEAEAKLRYELTGRAAREADLVLCVSHKMAEYLVDTYGIDAAKIVVSPCCVDTKRFHVTDEQRAATRRELGVGQRYVVAYCGSLQSWQCPEQSVDLYQQVRAMRSDAFFLGITTQPDKLRSLLRSRGIADADHNVLSVGHDQVARYVGTADASLLIRMPSLVNAVASPVKFAEYVASGTPVIVSEGVGDYSGMVQSQRLGCVIPHHGSAEARLREFLAGYAADPAAWRARCRAAAERELSAEGHVERVTAAYRQLAGAMR